MTFAQQLEAAWYRGARWLWLLLPLEWLFRLVVQIRRALYRAGLLSRYRAPVPVVVIGNITLGGTGKTPAVIALASELTAQNLRVGIVSRGVARQGVGVHLVDESSSVNDCGDEALLLFQRTGCPCAVAKNRGHAIEALLSQHPLDLILSDDGMQHYAMHRDMEILLYDAESSFGNGRCLPAGPLREPLSRLAEADFVLAKKAVSPAEWRHAAAQSKAPSSLALTPSALVNVATGEEVEASTARTGEDVFAVSGIGRPAQFHALLGELGFKPRARVFRDHHLFTQQDFDSMQNLPVIMTEKDAVKCRGLSHKSLWYLKVDAELPEEVVAGVLALFKQ
jgi:tetraacyldisaccharide 4'-kinase